MCSAASTSGKKAFWEVSPDMRKSYPRASACSAVSGTSARDGPACVPTLIVRASRAIDCDNRAGRRDILPEGSALSLFLTHSSGAGTRPFAFARRDVLWLIIRRDSHPAGGLRCQKRSAYSKPSTPSGAIREFKPDPVSDDLVHKLIESATKAPSGGNRQPWRFIVIRDEELKRRIGEYYRRAWDASYGPRPAPRGSLQSHVRASATHLSEHLAEAPVLILACVEHDGSPGTMSRGSSIYPAVQNLLLAARGLGLGSVITSLHKQYEEEIKELLGIPQNVETAALLPVGFPVEGVRYGPTRRSPVEEVTYRERWGSDS